MSPRSTLAIVAPEEIGERPAPSDREAFAAWQTLERWRASLVAAQLAGADTRRDVYVNGKRPHLPPGWTADRFLRWCRDRLRDGAVRVERDGKLRRVRCADLDAWVAKQSDKAMPMPVADVPAAEPANVDDQVARELGLRPARRSR